MHRRHKEEKRMGNLSQIEINSAALLGNVRRLRRICPPQASFVAVVKGNAYGHGLEPVVRILDGAVDGFQVDDIEELKSLRQLTNKRALLLGYVRREDLAEAVDLDAELAIYDTERLVELDRLSAKVHIKIDALLGRQGVVPRDLDAFLVALREAKRIKPVATYAHFANIEDTTDLVHARDQMEVFETSFAKCRAHFPKVGRHLSATSALLTVENGNDIVRVGIGLYGMYPSAPLARQSRHLGLEPVLRWVSHLAQVKTLPNGHPVGYGLTYITGRETRIGIVPQGYSDGYDRGLSNVGEVLVRGQRCPVLGRIAMNMFAIDLSTCPEAKVEEEVVLLGSQGDSSITAEEMAAQLGTINYEVTTRLSPLLPRVLK
jgi:alanine racemase